MKKSFMVLAAATVLGFAWMQTAIAAPQPFDVPVKWELQFDFQAPRAIQVVLPGETQPKTFWYMLYTVTNQSVDIQTGRGTEQDFIPEFVLYTDTGKVSYSGKKVSSAVFDEIKKRYNNPLLQNRTNITGKILFGRDNAKDGVAIWPDFDPKSGAFDIFVGGLSGETSELKLPKPITVTEIDAFGKKQTVTKDKIILSKMLKLNFTVKGEAAARIVTPAKLKSKQWVIR